jgi:hypothetical protein
MGTRPLHPITVPYAQQVLWAHAMESEIYGIYGMATGWAVLSVHTFHDNDGSSVSCANLSSLEPPS